MRICQIVCVKNEAEALVELFFDLDNSEFISKKLKSNLNITRLNCVQNILEQMIEENENKEFNQKVYLLAGLSCYNIIFATLKIFSNFF